MTTFYKVLIVSLVVIMLGIFSFIAYKQNEIGDRQLAIESRIVEQKTLLDNITRSQSSYATSKDIAEYLDQNNIDLATIRDDLNKLNANIKSVNIITSSSDKQKYSNMPETNFGPSNPNPVYIDAGCTNPDVYGYLDRQSNLSIYEKFKSTNVPFGTASFSAWQENPWSLSVNERKYTVSTVVGTDENERQYFYNKFFVDVAGKSYEIPINTAVTKQEYPTASWSFNPRLFLSVSGGINISQIKGEFTPSLNLGLISYGKSKKTPDFSVAQVGVGYGVVSKKIQFIISPFSYNIGKHIPLMNNLYIGPAVDIGVDGGISIMGAASVGL